MKERTNLINFATGRLMLLLVAAALAYAPSGAVAAVLQALKAEPSGTQDVVIAFQFDAPVTPSKPFALEGSNPKVVLDFPSASNGTQTSSVPVGIRFVRELQIIEAAGRTRVIINTSESAAFRTRANGNYVYLALAKRDTVSSQPAINSPVAASPTATPTADIDKPAIDGITDIQFRRGADGEGRIVISLSNPNLPLDINEEKQDQLIINVARAGLPMDLQRRLDVIDFGTPVQTIDAFKTDDGSRILVNTDGAITHLAYQTDTSYTLEIRRKAGVVEEESVTAVEFSGEKLSLNFQDIETRAVLQVIAEFTGLNIVVSDSVGGNITLRLNDVPWDQALDLVLQSQGLAMRRTGNVVLVAPSEELAQQERLELESRTQLTELSPIRSEIFKIRYADVMELFALISGTSGDAASGDTGDEAEGDSGNQSLLSSRGRIIADERTNTLIIYESAELLAEIRDLIDKLDIPVRQVLIESRIVSVQDDYFKSLGVRFGFSGDSDPRTTAELHRRFGGTTDGFFSPAGGPVGVATGENEGLITAFPAAGSGGAVPATFAFFAGDAAQRLIQLEISALQQDGKAEVISTPRVITADQQAAQISQGVLIPFQEATSSGATSTSFQEATLSLEVTPQITPDDNVIMALEISDDRPATTSANIETSEISTNVRVPNGDTLVLGGIFRENKSELVNKVPILGDLPLIGNAFRNRQRQKTQSELLVFITPKILPDLAVK